MDIPSHNRVELVGRVSAAADSRTLPSGDVVTSFRLVVPRSAVARRRSRQTVDTFDCNAWTAKLRRSVAKLEAGSIVRVDGTLRRQFSRVAGAPVSRVTVDLTAISVVTPVASEA